MSAKKTNARKRPEAKRAKSAKSKVAGRKALKAKPAEKVRAKAPAKRAVAKTAPKPVAKKAVAPKPPAKTAAKPVVSAIKVKAVVAKAETKLAKPAASTKRSSKNFDPERRRELIAAAAARHRKAQVNRIAPVAVIQPRPLGPVERHRFSVGDEVRVISTSGMWFKHGVDYRITAALPPQAGKLQYRIKNAQEPFERVVSESQLAAPHQNHAHL